jgi:hypothetical protein
MAAGCGVPGGDLVAELDIVDAFALPAEQGFADSIPI